MKRNGVVTDSIGVGNATPYQFDGDAGSDKTLASGIKVGVDRNNGGLSDGRWLNGEISALIFIAGTLTTDEAEALRSYLQFKYGTV